MSRPHLVPLTPGELDEEQRRLYDAVAEGPRGQGATRPMMIREDGSLTGPFDAWLRTPILGEHFERAGMAFRTDTTLSAAPREIAVLVVARAWSAKFEWWAHCKLARLEKVPQSVIDDIAAYRRPTFEDDACEGAHDVAFQLVHRRTVDTETMAFAQSALGDRALVEVISMVGFYQMVSGLLESFHPPAASADLPVEGPPPAPGLAGMDLFAAASTTRAVRRLKADPIPEETLRRVLLAATWAPSGANRQPWRVIAVKEPSKKAQLAKLYGEQWAGYAEMSRKRMEGAPEPMQQYIERTLAAGDHLAANMGAVPVLAVFCFNPEELHITDREQNRPSVVGGASLYPAVQNLLLACRAEGLGCVLTTLLCSREEEVRQLLEIPDPWATHACVPMGWPVGGGHGPLSRRPLEDAAYLDRFGDSLV